MDILLIVYMISTVGLVITVKWMENKGVWGSLYIERFEDIFPILVIVVASPILFAWAIYEYYIKKGK